MQVHEEHSFVKIDSSTDIRLVAPDSMVDAQDVEHFEDDFNTIGRVRPIKSTKLAFELGTQVAQHQRITYVFSTGTHDYTFTGTYNGTTFTFTVTGISSEYALRGEIQAGIYNNCGHTIASANNGYIEFYDYSTWTLDETIDGTSYNIYTIQDSIASTSEVVPLQAIYINEDLIYFAKTKDSSYSYIGGATRSLDGTWTHKMIAGSKTWGFVDTEPIDARIELRSDDIYSLYWCDNTNKPKTLYFPNDFINYDYSAIKYIAGTSTVITNPRGFYSFNAINEQTNQQLTNATASIQYKEQLNYGGALSAGTWRYAVQFGVQGTDYTTPFTDLSEPVIVFSSSTASVKGADIKGDTTPTITTKSNIVEITNANANVFNFINLACVQYQGGAVSATSVLKLDIPSDTFTITHTGLELNTTTLDIAAIPNVMPVILKNKSIEIKKNRYNTANVELAVDEDLQSIASAITISQALLGDTKTIDSVGVIAPISNTNVFDVYNGATGLLESDNFAIVCKGANLDIGTPPVYKLWNGNPSDNTNGQYVVTTDTAGGNILNVKMNLYATESTTVPTDPFGNDINLDCTFIINVNGVPVINYPIRIGAPNKIGLVDFWYCHGAVNLDFNVSFNSGDIVTFRVEPNSAPDVVLQASNIAISCVHSASSSTNYKKDLKIGEYNNPDNVSKYLGYMAGETYAFFIKFRYKNGYISNPYYINKYTFAQFCLIDNGKPRVFHPVFNNINITSIKDKIDSFSIVRAKCNPTILATGVYMPANNTLPAGVGVGYYASQPDNIAYGTIVGQNDPLRKFGAFLSSDLMFSENGLKYSGNDVLNIWGAPQVSSHDPSFDSSTSLNLTFSYCEYLDSVQLTPQSTFINDSVYVKSEDINTKYSEYIKNIDTTRTRVVLDTSGNYQTLAQDCQFLTTTDCVQIPYTGGSDYGVYSANIYRSLDNQYDIKNVDIVDCGHFQPVTPSGNNVFSGVEVYGGDVYTQKVYMRVLNNSIGTRSGLFKSSFISFYSQNRINAQMRHSNLSTTTTGTTTASFIPLFPADAATLSDYLTPKPPEVFVIDEGYNQADNIINKMRAYNSKLAQQSKFHARIYYSQQKPTGSIYDGYRDIKPLDFKDIDSKNGGIVALNDINDTMLAVQPKAVTSLPYQSDVLLKSDSGAEIYIGNGGVYAQRETIVSTFGSSIKTATFAGFNKNGNKVLYWFSPYNKRVMRYSYDGIKIISDDSKMRNYFINNTSFVQNEYDIHMGFDIKRNNLLISTNCQKNIVEWSNTQTYTAGQYVKCSTNTLGFFGRPDIYLCLQPNGSPYPSPPYNQDANFDVWQLVPHTDNNYYNEWTLLFNEQYNAFTTRSSLVPNRYFIYKNDVLVPRGVTPQGALYELNNGTDILKWLDYNNSYIQGEFLLVPVINKASEFTKAFLSLGLNTGDSNVNNPIVTCTTQTQSGIVDGFEQINSMLWCAVPNSSVGDTLEGEYMTVKITSQADINLLGMTAKAYYRPRLPHR